MLGWRIRGSRARRDVDENIAKKNRLGRGNRIGEGATSGVNIIANTHDEHALTLLRNLVVDGIEKLVIDRVGAVICKEIQDAT